MSEEIDYPLFDRDTPTPGDALKQIEIASTRQQLRRLQALITFWRIITISYLAVVFSFKVAFPDALSSYGFNFAIWFVVVPIVAGVFYTRRYKSLCLHYDDLLRGV